MRICLALAVCAAAASPALAERPDDRYWLSATGLFSSVDTTARIDASSGIGTEISLEKDVGLKDSSSLPTVLGGLRISQHWRVEVEYLPLHRSGSKILSRIIKIGNTTYAVNTRLNGALNSDTYRVGFGYPFVRNPNAEFGASIGAHVTRFTEKFSGSGTVNNTAVVAVGGESRGVTAPLPTVGLYGTYVLSPVFSIAGRADYLSIKIGDIKGKLIDGQVGVTARVFRNVGVGGGYRYVEYGVTATKGNFQGKINYSFHGPVIFAEVAF